MNDATQAKVLLYGFWLLVLGGLTWGFHTLDERQRNPNQSVQMIERDGVREVVLQRNRQGHYLVHGLINGQPVEFLIDTGATRVAIPEPVAQSLRLARGTPESVNTANGTATVYNVRLDSLSLGAIEARDVRAHISPGMQGREVLLGMSVLRDLEIIQRDGTLTLRQLSRHER